MVKSKYFNVGKVVATIGVNNTIKENEQFAKEIISALRIWKMQLFRQVATLRWIYRNKRKN